LCGSLSIEGENHKMINKYATDTANIFISPKNEETDEMGLPKVTSVEKPSNNMDSQDGFNNGNYSKMLEMASTFINSKDSMDTISNIFNSFNKKSEKNSTSGPPKRKPVF